MIEFTTGDILKTDAEALVNTVNCVGIMGRGVALQFKNAFPANFKAYKIACNRKEVQPGRMFIYETGYVDNPKYIINFPTKRHWKGKSRLEDIEAGLRAFVEAVKRFNISSVAMPPLGSGLGGLHWPLVRRAIEAAMQDLPDVKVTIFEPRESAAGEGSVSTSRVPDMTPGRAALVALMRRYLDGLLDPFVTLLEVHKLMYFMQESGEPLRLRYVKGPYGPYAENLRHVLTSIDGYLLSGYGDGGESPGKELTIVPGAAEDAEAFLRHHADVQARFARVADLVQGFETPFGLELLATVHWVLKHERALSPDALEAAVYAWGDRKKQFTPRQISLAYQAILTKGWHLVS
ncbi:MAG: macro domain-containing protein [Acidobacteriota bacterium]|nr:macro domain-containing protein [Acidobacteriota bacterium]MDQ3417213.1 macro domain-containing protein [Acidobacteriota bacterium]